MSLVSLNDFSFSTLSCRCTVTVLHNSLEEWLVCKQINMTLCVIFSCGTQIDRMFRLEGFALQYCISTLLRLATLTFIVFRQPSIVIL